MNPSLSIVRPLININTDADALPRSHNRPDNRTMPVLHPDILRVLHIRGYCFLRKGNLDFCVPIPVSK